jgi:hypothetical protein
MNKLVIYGILTGGLIFILRYIKKSARNRREKYIDSFFFPQTVKNNILQKYPHLTTSQVNEVVKGLKEYFHLCNMAGEKFVSMPSQVVDVAWHEFILFTKQYQLFCSKALSRFLHHVPAEAMLFPTNAQEGIRRAWRLSCKREKINPESPTRLPILFRLDTELNIPNGFYYAKNCKNASGEKYCASHIGCSSCGGIGSLGDSMSSGDSTGCGGGCGGD